MAESKAGDTDSRFKKVTPNHLRSLHERDQAKRLIVILEGASLETIKVYENLSDIFLSGLLTPTATSLELVCFDQLFYSFSLFLRLVSSMSYLTVTSTKVK